MDTIEVSEVCSVTISWTTIWIAVTALAAVVYAILTYRLLREAQKQTEGQIAPVIGIALDTSGNGNLILKNVGGGVAVKVKLVVTLDENPKAQPLRPRPTQGQGRLTRSIDILESGGEEVVGLCRPELLGEYAGMWANFDAYYHDIQVDYQSVSGKTYWTRGHVERGRLVEERTEYHRPC